MKNLVTVFAVLCVSVTSAMAFGKSISCGCDSPDTMGAGLHISLVEDGNNYKVSLSRYTMDNSVIVNTEVASELKCEFSTIDPRAATCSGGYRPSPSRLSIRVVNETSSSGQTGRFEVSLQSAEIKKLDQKKLQISGIFNNSEVQFSEVMNLTLNTGYGCVYAK